MSRVSPRINSNTMILPIVTYPADILEKKAEVVQFPLDKETTTLIKNMWDTVKGKGVGLASPQVGVSKQIILINSEEAELEDKTPNLVMINPTIIFESRVKSCMIEGCLSFPDEYYELERPANIIVQYYDQHGKKTKLKAKNFLARIIQHEVAHLNGRLFINEGGRKLDKKELEGLTIVD